MLICTCSRHHFGNTAFLISGVFVEIPLIPLDILNHKVFAGELNVVREMIDKLVVTWKIYS
jgi:hypothetical protein